MMSQPKDGHLIVNVVLLLAMTMLGLLSCCSVSLNLLDFFGVIDGFSQSTYASGAERAGGLTAYLWVGAWAVWMVLTGPVAAIGLLRRRPWSRVFTMVVWIVCAAGCCCTVPLCFYGLWSLNTAQVKALFAITH